MLCFWLAKTKEKGSQKAAVMMNHLSKDNIQGHFTRKLFFGMVFMLGQIIIRVRNYMYYPSCGSGKK